MREDSALTPKLAAPQHKPRPLTLFLEMLRSMTAHDPQQMEQALLGLRRYQEAEREPSPPLMPVITEANGAMLRDYGGGGPPLLFVPSLINPPNVLDLPGERSMLRWFAAQHFRVLLLDWGSDGAARRSMSVADHVEQIIVPLMATLDDVPALVGYCLGGTMAVGAAALAPVAAVATIAAPWHFAGFPDAAQQMLAQLWQASRPNAEALGVLPMEVLQSAFWSLDPARTIAKFQEFAAVPPGSEEARAFVTLEDWANDGPPIAAAAAREMFEDFIGADRPGRGEWRVGARVADPSALACPLLNIVSTRDRIVPHATAIRHGERIDLDQGHVGMIVGSRAKEALWQPLAAWLSSRSAS
jgi:polyhydroxyalkanoate synthase subunit PhaC